MIRKTLCLGASAALALLLLASLAYPALAGTLTVTNGNDAGAGSLRQAIADAADGDTILFDGDYDITLASTLDIDKDVTIDGGDYTITISGNDAVRVFHVYTDTQVTLERLTISHGRTTVPEDSGSPVGGGVKIETGAVVTLADSAILSNTTKYYDSEHASYLGYGGGIYNLGALTVLRSNLSGNIAGDPAERGDSCGGAIHNRGVLTVTDSVLTDNDAGSMGGGIRNVKDLTLTKDGTLTILRSTISGNTSPCGGAGIANKIGTVVVTDSTIADNVASGTWCEASAAGISNSGDFSWGGSIEVWRSVISGNVNVNNSGGGLGNYEGQIYVLESTIRNNTAGSNGGGIVAEQYGVVVINSAIFSNTAVYGGGGVYAEGWLVVFNSTLVGNTASYGGGLYDKGSDIWHTELVNSILWNNSASVSGPQISTSIDASPTISSSLIQDSGGSSSWDTNLGTDDGGNIDADPRFLDAANGDLRLAFGSPAIDVGNNAAIETEATTDLAGNPRIVNGVVDMGAYEGCPELRLLKSVGPIRGLGPDDTVTYTLRVTNTGAITDASLQVTDALPDGVDFGGWVTEPAGVVRSGKTFTWTGSIDPEETQIAVFTATVAVDYGEIISNTAHFSGSIQSGESVAAFSTYRYLTMMPIILKKTPSD